MIVAASHSPLPRTRLAGAIGISALAHALGLVVLLVLARPHAPDADLVDIELAPPPPPAEALPAEVARPIRAGADEAVAAAAAAARERAPDDEAPAADAGIDAAPAADAAPPADAAPARVAKQLDAAVPAIDAGSAAELADLAVGSGVGSATGSDTGSAAVGSAAGAPGAIAVGTGSGSAGTEDLPAVAGAPTSPGTAANLLAYLPPGHVITALVRFDRLRGTEWAKPAEALAQPMPDYRALFGARDADLADSIDMLVISTPRPRDVAATTLVMQTHLPRSAVRDLLGAGVTWRAARGGLLGTRTSGFPGDRRVLISPWRGWFLLAQPADLGGLTAPGGGDPDTALARGPLPPWLAQLRSIAHESGDGGRGPALVLTLAGAPAGSRPARTGHYKLPDVGLGVTELPVPARLSLAMELVPHGWLVRGNIVFASEADAADFVASITGAQHTLVTGRLASALLARQHLLDAVTNLSLAQSGARVSYATSLSIADARAVLAVAGALVAAYFH